MKRLFTCQDCGEIYSYEDLLQDRTILTEGGGNL